MGRKKSLVHTVYACVKNLHILLIKLGEYLISIHYCTRPLTYDIAVTVLISEQECFTSISTLDNLHTTVTPVRAIAIACDQGIGMYDDTTSKACGT